MGSALRDLRHALRSLSRQPGFALVAITSIALGIGFNAVIFSAVNALLIRPVGGIDDPDRVVEVGRTNDGRGFNSFSYADLVDLRENVPALAYVAAWKVGPLSFAGGGGGERVIGMSVSAGYFEALGVVPVRGRTFGPEEDTRGGPAVAVISHRFWTERLGGGPEVVGRTIDINRVPVTVVGVAPEGFGGHFPMVSADVWLPFTQLAIAVPGTSPELFESRRHISLQVVGRLAPGVTIEQADAAVDAAMARLAEAYPESNRGRGAAVVPLGPIPGGGRDVVAGFLGALMGLVSLILLVAAANVAGMLLARAAAREKEVAIRLAIGSGRARLVRQLVAETLVLFLAGALGGMLLATWATSLVSTISAPGVELTLDLSPDGTVLAFGIAAALVTGLIFGLAPALQATRPDLVSALKDEGRTGRRGSRTRRLFVAVQVGLSLVLLAAGGLLLRSLLEAHRMSAGFEPAGVHMTSLDLSLDGYTRDTAMPVQAELRRALLRRFGVEAAALANDLPMDLSENGAPVWPDGGEGSQEHGVGADFNAVSPGYFETLRIPVVRGRDFTDADRVGALRVAVVSQEFARRAWGDADPIGRQLRWGRADDEPRTVIGVVGEVKNQTLGETADGMVYLPLAQRYTPAVHVLARGPAAGAAALRGALLDVDPRLALSTPQTLESITSVGLLPARVAAIVTGLLAGLGLFLAALGVYGVVAYGVTQRRREIGIRLAVGARTAQVLRMILLSGFRLAAPGLVVGAVAAFGVGQLLRGMLLGVSPADPLTFVAVAAVLLAAVALASWVPARRAAAVDPMEALRAE
ncbi:MAG TPA: ABC transporter permease [Longimicrobiales bacterium]|nr:ABC transporter permease [Longimicrobiales bacterium]